MNLANSVKNESLSSMTILIVDDEPINAAILEGFLEGMFKIRIVHSGEEALVMCETTPPDLILLDYMLQGMSGLETCKVLKRTPATSDIPIIFVTGNTSIEDQNKCWDAGCVDFISKPVSSQTVRNRVKTHMKYKLQTDNLIKMTYLDGLTGLYNRHLLNEVLPRNLLQGNRSGITTAVLMIDVDHFKDYNDFYGHLSGDEALKKIANVIKKILQRPADFAVRFGGEEFLCLLPETDIEGAKCVAEAILQGVNKMGLIHERSPHKIVTVSIGCAIASPNTSDSGDLIQSADDKLYEAKKSGRNRMAA